MVNKIDLMILEDFHVLHTREYKKVGFGMLSACLSVCLSRFEPH
jgi:hypothetical protein